MLSDSLSALKRERDELRRDRVAFASALDILQKRIIESNESEIPRQPLLHTWSGTRASVGSLEMALHAVERVLNDVEQMIYALESGAGMNTDVIASKGPKGSN